MRIDNVVDRRGGTGVIGSWEAEPLDYRKLGPEHVGRTCIYRSHNRNEAGTITSWRDGVVFARYTGGDTSAGSNHADLVLGVRSIPLAELEGVHSRLERIVEKYRDMTDEQLREFERHLYDEEVDGDDNWEIREEVILVLNFRGLA